jgi:hypothetical protein
VGVAGAGSPPPSEKFTTEKKNILTIKGNDENVHALGLQWRPSNENSMNDFADQKQS